MVLIITSITFIIYSIINHKKNKIRAILPFALSAVWIIFLPYYPSQNRVSEIVAAQDEITSDNSVIENNIPNISDNDDYEYIDTNINKTTISPNFYTVFYNYEYDSMFWKEIAERSNYDYIDYRKMETLIIQRVKRINGNSWDTVFGISNSRLQNFVNIEKDFVLHYYAYGIVGSLLLLSFYLFSLFKGIKNFDIIDFKSTILFESTLLFILSSFFIWKFNKLFVL